MRLKTKLSLAFLVVAWLPLGGVVWVLTDRMDAAFRGSFEAQNRVIEAAVKERLREVADELGQALARISEDPLLDRDLLQPLARGRFYGNLEIDYERAIVREARRLINAPTLDTLRIVDLGKAGQVIAMGHRTGVEPPDAGAVALAEAPTGTIVFRRERVENTETGAADLVWTLQAVHTAGARVALLGGRIVDQRLLESLRVVAGESAEILLVDAAGERVAATFVGAEPPATIGGWAVASSRIENPGAPTAVATLKVFLSRGQVATMTQELWTTAAILASATGLLALLTGLWISRRLSRPLEALSEAATDVAEGARDRQVLELRGDDEVARLTRSFNQMTLDLSASEERLRQSERIAAWREIARRIAHEIKNPLFPIQMSIETLKKVYERKHPDFDEIFQESTATILEEVGRMKRIVSEFSDFARMPAPRPQAVDLSDLVASALALHRDTAPGVALQQGGDPALTLQADPDQLRQAVMNLVQNGIDALNAQGPAEGATLEVRVEADEPDGVRLVVTDNGPGMDAETQGKLFVPYFTTKTEGTGLGLAIVHRIVAEHGGSIQVDSQPDVGTRFVLRLPRYGPSSISA